MMPSNATSIGWHASVLLHHVGKRVTVLHQDHASANLCRIQFLPQLFEGHAALGNPLQGAVHLRLQLAVDWHLDRCFVVACNRETV